jgi:hypothetical protein
MKLQKLIAPLVAVLALSACGGPTGTKSEAPGIAATGEGVEARAQQRWDLLIAGKPDQAWNFFSPGYREIKDQATYASDVAVRPVKWTKAVVKGSQCPDGPEVCNVEVEVHFSMESSLPGVGKLESYSPILERWIEIEGTWYFVPKEVARN